MSARFSIVLLSEDSSEGTRNGLKAIVDKLLKRSEDDGFTRRVEMLPAPGNIRPIVIANRWRSKEAKDEPAKRALWKYLASKISEPTSFVLFHYDGDTVWSERTGARSIGQFGQLRTKVEQVLHGLEKPLSAQEIDRRLARLIECVPFYSVEAWTLQATERAAALCRENSCGGHIGHFEAWAGDRAKLDEVSKPKDATCLHDGHNEELGKNVRVWDVVQAGCSLTSFVWKLHSNRELEDALATP